MTIDEARAHYTKLAQDSGLSPEATTAFLQAMDNDRFRGALSTGYQRHDEYSRGMDALRAEKERLRQWYEQEELPKYQLYQQGSDELRRYKERYGALDDGLNNGRGGMQDQSGNGNLSRGMSKEEIDKYVEDKLRQRDNAYVQLMKDSASIPMDHYTKFGKPLSRAEINEIEKVALDNGVVFNKGYELWVQPKEREAAEARHKEELEKAKAEAVRDYQSRMKLPVDTKPKEAHPFFDRKTVDKNISEVDQDRHSREAFMQGWNNYQEELQQQQKS
jgi:hypothetical protein